MECVSKELSGRESSGKQVFVFLDVGGTPFKMLPRTIENYPDSLIAKVMAECPNSGKEGCPLYVDRHPKTFEWILEVYRNGDLEGSMPPGMSAEYLQRELDFYQLPSLEDLGLNNAPRVLPFKEKIAAKKLMEEIVHEIVESGLVDLHPWYVFIYHELKSEGPVPRRRVFVCPDGLGASAFPSEYDWLDRGSDSFSRLRRASPRDIIECRMDRMRLRLKFESGEEFMVQLVTDKTIGPLKEEASRFGLLAKPEIWSFRAANLTSAMQCRILHLSCSE